MIRTCATCRYSRPPLSEDGFPLTEEEAKQRNWLFCQIAPPVAIPGQIDCYPAVSPGERCGEWQGEGEGDAPAIGDALSDELDAIYTLTSETLDALNRNTTFLRTLTEHVLSIKHHLNIPRTPDFTSPLFDPTTDTEGSV